jgi:hypothetical protein
LPVKKFERAVYVLLSSLFQASHMLVYRRMAKTLSSIKERQIRDYSSLAGGDCEATHSEAERP